MINKNFKRNLAYEVIIFLALMALLMFITRIWALLFLIILGIFIAALVLLFKRPWKVETIEPAALPEPSPRPETEKDLLRRAYSLLQLRITDEVNALHPSAHWQWLTPNPMSSIERDEPLVIILNGAGGYRKAAVSIHNLIFKGLVYETVQTETAPGDGQREDEPVPDFDTDEGYADDHLPEGVEEPVQTEPETVNYEYMAFEWVDSRLLVLNNRSNEAIGQGKRTLLIPADELPARSSWQAVCEQLIKNDFADAVAHEDGILVSLVQ